MIKLYFTILINHLYDVLICSTYTVFHFQVIIEMQKNNITIINGKKEKEKKRNSSCRPIQLK